MVITFLDAAAFTHIHTTAGYESRHLGSGDMGLKLTDSFVATGRTIKIGTRKPDKVASWAGQARQQQGI
ncbi:NAD(P)-binding domain-containing protein [Candidatus Nitrososphaera gargensis]|uniref:NAD(P)-binding domain-containing protein n=1 Tax=Candidatus Nitrososphaera gargensis TaxID=497727 RepID=UPI002B213019|nr:NAD(P)-binding domain-containing protein [Candidatus Nitrososphaera gargensis]